VVHAWLTFATMVIELRQRGGPVLAGGPNLILELS
jgi:hypothetical protein